MSQKQYTVQAPDGRTVTLEGPEGASQEEVIAQAQRLLGSAPQGMAGVVSGGSFQQQEPTGIVAGAKRGFSNLNPFNILKAIKQDSPLFQGPLTEKNVDERMAQYEAALQHASEHPIASTLNQIPIVGPLLSNFAERVPKDPSGAVAETAVTVGVPLAIAKGIDMIPRTSRAGENFDAVMAKAKDVPLKLSEADDAALRARELAGGGGAIGRGHTLPKVMSDYLRTRESRPEMTYEVGRDFASSASSLSAAEKSSIKGPMKAQIAQLAKALNDSNREAAVQAGVGDVYDAAMKEYRQAKMIGDAAGWGSKMAKRAALAAVLGKAWRSVD